MRTAVAISFLLTFACAVCCLAAERPSSAKPLMVQAWRKQGETKKEFETRLVDHLKGFKTPAVELDQYGGWKGEKFAAKGFFYAKQLKDRWWLIDPDGYRYLHIAMNSVTSGHSPQNKEAFPKKFGTKERWRDETVKLLTDCGFNGTGSWSADDLLKSGPRRLAYTPNLNFMSSYGKKRGGTFQEPGHTGYPNKCIFAFDPAFETFADEHAATLTKLKDDPFLLGYFTDNELPFPKDSLDRYLQLEAKDAGRQAAEAFVKQRKADAKKLTDADREAWLEHLVDRYFGVVTRAIRKHDPHHMILGSRFHSYEKGSQGAMRAAGRHLDVVAINVYGVWTPTAETIGRWATWAGKPMMATEWYAKGADSGMANTTGAGWTVATQQDRGRFYQTFTLGLLESKGCVGWHWFKYGDNDPQDTTVDPSNRDSNKGIVNVRYEPYQPLLDAMRQLNTAAYPLTEYFDKRR